MPGCAEKLLEAQAHAQEGSALSLLRDLMQPPWDSTTVYRLNGIRYIYQLPVPTHAVYMRHLGTCSFSLLAATILPHHRFLLAALTWPRGPNAEVSDETIWQCSPDRLGSSMHMLPCQWPGVRPSHLLKHEPRSRPDKELALECAPSHLRQQI